METFPTLSVSWRPAAGSPSILDFLSTIWIIFDAAEMAFWKSAVNAKEYPIMPVPPMVAQATLWKFATATLGMRLT